MVALHGLACTSFEEAGAGTQLTENRCLSDADCDADARCQENVCVASTARSRQSVWLRIQPDTNPAGTSGGVVFRQVSGIQTTKTENLKLPRPVVVKTLMRRGDEHIAGSIQFSQVPDLPLTLEGELKAKPTMVSVTEGATEAATVGLIPGQTYQAIATPDARYWDSLPPQRRQFVAKEGQTIAFEYGDELLERSYIVTGLREGVEFEALARSTDRGEPRLSTRVPVVNGAFTLKFGDDHSDYRVELRPQEEATRSDDTEGELDCTNAQLLHDTMPTFSIDPETLAQDDAENFLIHLPQLPTAIEYSGVVPLCVGATNLVESLNRPLSINIRSKQIDLLTDDGSGPGAPVDSQAVELRYNREAVTFPKDNALHYCFAVLPGLYQVVVVPPAVADQCGPGDDADSCGCGLFAKGVVFRAPEGQAYGRGIELELPTMASLSGTLLAMDESPIGGAAIEANPLPTAIGVALEGDDLAEFSRFRDTRSVADGAFRLPLDVGAYDVTIKPPADAGFPWMVIRDVLVANRSEEFVKDVVMNSPLSISGHVSYEGGDDEWDSTLVGAHILAFAVVEDSQSPSESRAISIGEATVDRKGDYMLLLPPEQQRGWFQ